MLHKCVTFGWNIYQDTTNPRVECFHWIHSATLAPCSDPYGSPVVRLWPLATLESLDGNYTFVKAHLPCKQHIAFSSMMFRQRYKKRLKMVAFNFVSGHRMGVIDIRLLQEIWTPMIKVSLFWKYPRLFAIPVFHDGQLTLKWFGRKQKLANN